MPDYCRECAVREVYARLFDAHWLGKEDCPYWMSCVDGDPTIKTGFRGGKKPNNENR